MRKPWKLKHSLGMNSYVAGHLRNPSFGFGRPQYSLLRNPISAVKQSLVHPIHMDSLKGLAAAGVGAIGTAAIPSHWLISKIPVIGNIKLVNLLLGNAINITLMGTAAKMAFKSRPEISKNVVIGGLTMTGLQMFMLLSKQLPNVQVLQTVAASTAMAGLGDNNVLRAKVQEAVRRELGQPKAESSFSTVKGLPFENSYSTVGSPEAESSYSTVGGNDNLTDDDLN